MGLGFLGGFQRVLDSCEFLLVEVLRALSVPGFEV